MKKILSTFLKEEDGQGMVEYGLIIAGVAIAAIVAIWAFGDNIQNLFNGIKFDGSTPAT